MPTKSSTAAKLRTAARHRRRRADGTFAPGRARTKTTKRKKATTRRRRR